MPTTRRRPRPSDTRYRPLIADWLRAVLLLLAPLTAAAQSITASGPSRPDAEIVIVTARKVAEDALLVPASIQVLTSDHFDATDPTDLYELQFDVPGLVVANTGMNGAGISLRGVTAEAGQGLAVAPHFNGIYLGRPMVALSRLFDVERVEVLKGPQGTLYGRNATGGSINVLGRAPEYGFSSSVETAAGSFDSLRIEGHVNLAASERVAIRLAAVGSESDGYIRNSVDERRFAEEDYGAVRASIGIRPTEAMNVRLTAQHMHDDGGSGELWLPNRAFLPDPNDIRLTTVTLEDPYLKIENDIVSLDVSREFRNGTLTSVSGYVRNLTRDIDDCSSLPSQGCVRSYQPRRFEQRSQELRFASATDNGPDWLVGFFVLDDDELSNFRLARLGMPPLSNYSAHQSERAAALFAQSTFRVGDRTNLTTGLRGSRETNDLTSTGTGTNDSQEPGSFSKDWDNISWRIGVDHAPAANLLYFGSISTGFKSGGAAGLLVTGEFDSFEPESLTAYEVGAKFRPAGQRWSLTGSAFLYDFEDLQVVTTTNISVAPNILFSVDNASDARIHGVDVSTLYDISDRLEFGGALVWLPKREFVDFTSMATGDVLSGNVLSRAPEWSSSLSLAYRRPVRASGEISVRADYAYRSEYFFTKENEPSSSQEAFGLLNLHLQFDSSERWYVLVSARNLLDEDYFTQAFIQSSPGRPSHYEAGFGFRL